MAKLKLGAIPDEKPVKMTIELPGSVHRDLAAYAEVLASVTGQAAEPAKLVPHMVARFIVGDREFMKQRRQQAAGGLTDTGHLPTATGDAAMRSAGRQVHPASPRFGTVDERLEPRQTSPDVSDNSN